uniref:Ovule protein n=1 Tax=Bursaphelenchus xylophilus TaxID=6326 RepID=A0A1I7RRX0_BURXY
MLHKHWNRIFLYYYSNKRLLSFMMIVENLESKRQKTKRLSFPYFLNAQTDKEPNKMQSDLHKKKPR